MVSGDSFAPAASLSVLLLAVESFSSVVTDDPFTMVPRPAAGAGSASPVVRAAHDIDPLPRSAAAGGRFPENLVAAPFRMFALRPAATPVDVANGSKREETGVLPDARCPVQQIDNWPSTGSPDSAEPASGPGGGDVAAAFPGEPGADLGQ